MRRYPVAGLISGVVYLAVLATLRLWTPVNLLIPAAALGCIWAWLLLGRAQPLIVAAAAWPPIHLLLLATGSLASPFLPLVALWPALLGRVTPLLAWLGVLGGAALIPLTQWTQTSTVETGAVPRLLIFLVVGALLPLLVSALRMPRPRRKARSRRNEEDLAAPAASAPQAPSSAISEPARPKPVRSDAISRALELVRRATDAEEAALWSVDADETQARLRGWVGGPGRKPTPSPVVLGDHPFNWVMTDQVHIHLERGRRELPTPWAREMLLIPLANRQALLALAYSTPVPPGAESAALLATQHLTEVLAQRQSATAAPQGADAAGPRDPSATDPITRLPNQTMFETRFAALSSHFLRYGRAFGLIILEVDRFSELQEQYGPRAANSLLHHLANLLHNCLREVDFAARLEGSEFVVLLPETSLHDAIRAADRIRELASTQPIPGSGTREFPTLSLGVASCPDCCAAPADAVAAATDALRRAKAAGGNRLLVAPIRTLADA